MKTKSKSKKLKLKIIIVAAILFVVIDLLIIAYAYGAGTTDKVQSMSIKNEPIVVDVVDGDTTSTVLQKLKDSDYIPSYYFAKVWTEILELDGFYVGHFEIPSSINGKPAKLDDIVKYISNPRNIIQ